MANAASPQDDRRVAGSSLLLTQLLKRPLLNPVNERLGRVEDVIVRIADTGHPRVTGLKASIGGRHLFVPEQLIARMSPDGVRLHGQTLHLGSFERRAGEVLLDQDVLDRRLIDVGTGRLVHASNLVLTADQDGWRLTGVDISPGGLLPRVLRRATPKPADILDWSRIQPFVGHVPTAGVLMPIGPFRRLHPAQIADLVEQASHEEGEEIINAVEADPELTADVFEELDPEHQVEFIQSRSDVDAAAVLARMAPDDAADLLNELDQPRRRPVLDLIPTPQGQKLRALLQYHPSTAGGMMSPDFISVLSQTPLSEVLDRVRSADNVPSQLLSSIFVTDLDNRLVGTVGLADIVRGAPDVLVDRLPGLVRGGVRVDTDLPEVALRMTDFNLPAVGVIDDADRLVGAISVDDLLEVVVPDEWRRREEASSGG
ncbi:MAG: magnesium transporter [Chloroflexi bacterium]|nr:magnesium transporter [Chloroflexota bacterium]